MSEKLKVMQVVTYGGHSLSANGAVSLTLKAEYSELTKTIQVIQMLNEDVAVKAKLAGQKPMKLGSFKIKDIKIDGDGESVLKFAGISDYVEMDNLNLLPLANEEAKRFQILMECETEAMDEGEEENKDGQD